jgi:hypothetical protein
MGISPSNLNLLRRTLRMWPAVMFAGLLLVLAYKALSGGPFTFLAPHIAQPAFFELGGRRLPQYSAITPSFISSVWPLMLLGFVLGLLALRFVSILKKSQKTAALVTADQESGASAVEFVLVLPALAMLLLMILQIALIVQAKFVVNYAAFCAARSAIVVIPATITISKPPEWRNHVGNPETSAKLEIIHRSAALPLTAISPLPGFSGTTGLPILTDPESTAELVKLAPFDVGPESMMAQVMLRAPYAYYPENTMVKIVDSQGDDAHHFLDHDWVTVKVSYRYYLAVPFAKRLFGTTYSQNTLWRMLFGTDYYYQIVEQYTLPVDSEPCCPGLTQ